MAEIEKAGIPTVSFVSRDFARPWKVYSSQFEVAELAKALMPRPFAGMSGAEIDAQVNGIFDALIQNLTGSHSEAAAFAENELATEIITIEGSEYAAFEEMNRMFLELGWSDGLPLWAATRERVDAMLRATRRSPQDVIAVLAPGRGSATVEKIAINAVMAGCQPEHLPVLIAAVDAISDPRFMLRHVAISTGPHAPLMLLNGPIVERIGVNSGSCALGPAAQSKVNTALGRAMRLIYMNLAHAYPGIMDRDTLGSPIKYSMCLGENVAASPWEPYHTEKGFDRDASVVTMSSSYGLSEIEDGTGTTPGQILNTACFAACNVGMPSVGFWLRGGRTDAQAGIYAKEKSLLLVCPVHADIFKRCGWSRQNIRDYLFEHARIPFAQFMANRPAASFRSAHPKLQSWWDTPDVAVPVLESPDCYEIAVAGGMSGARSVYSYGAAEPISRVIEE